MKDFICTNPWLDVASRRQTTKAKFEEQLKRFKPVLTSPKDPHSTPKITVSGLLDGYGDKFLTPSTGKTDKEGKVSGMFKDDLMCAFSLNMFLWDQLFNRKVPNFNYQLVFAAAA
jgi:hypothetical protein